MRYTKFLFIRFFCRCTASAACLALLCTGFAALGGCTDETDSIDGPSVAGGRIPLSLEITVGGFTGQPDASPSTRHTEKDNYDTWFDPGDAIGLFAVKGIGTADATIVDGISNTKLTFFRAESAEEKPTWRPADAATTLYYYKDVTYIAYYPYKENITIDPTQSKDAILASFSEKPELQPAADQSTPEAYAASDLITASGTAADTDDPNRKLLTLSFTHSYSLLVMKINRKSAKYVAPDKAFNYHPDLTTLVADADASDMTVWGIKAFKKAAGVFYVIVKNVNGTISGSYATGGIIVELNQSPTGLASLAKGKRYECTVNTPIPGTVGATERAVQVGDFYFEDGTIWPGGLDGVQEPQPPKTSSDGSLGVVFWAGNPAVGDAATGGYKGDPMLGTDHPECTHGLVMCKKPLADTQIYGKWGESAYSVDDWIKNYAPSSYYPASFDLTATDVCQGYSNTKAMKQFIIDKSNTNGVRKLRILTMLENFVPAPAGTSDWYIPSLAEMVLLIRGEGNDSGVAGKNLIIQQLEKMYGARKSFDIYCWTSTEETGTKETRQVWAINTDDGTTSLRHKVTAAAEARAILAF